jgi:hypothetical protein
MTLPRYILDVSGVAAAMPRTHVRSIDAVGDETILMTKLHLEQGVRRAARTRRLLARLLMMAAAAAPMANAQNGKLAPSAIASYDNRWEAYGGVNFMNFQAGQNLPTRMNFAGAEGQATYWLTNHLGVTGDYRFEGGTTPVSPNPYYKGRVAVYEHIGMAGVTYRGPKGRYAAVDYHALFGVGHGIFDSAIQGYPGGSPVTAQQIGLYSNRTKPMAALGGSVDFNYTKNIAIRLSPDLILEHFGTETREFFAISGGVMYRFGRR